MKRRSLLKLLGVVGIAPAVSKAKQNPEYRLIADTSGPVTVCAPAQPTPPDTVFDTYSALPAPQHFKRNAIVLVVSDPDPYLNGSHLNTGLYWRQL